MEKLLNWQFVGKELMTGLPEYRNGTSRFSLSLLPSFVSRSPSPLIEHGIPRIGHGCPLRRDLISTLLHNDNADSRPLASLAGGLLIDYNLLVPNIPALLRYSNLPVPSSPSSYPTLLEIPPLDPSHSPIVEMRAVTIIMLDRLADGIRKKIGYELSLPQVLESGTWKSGREVAKRLRPETSGPPFQYIASVRLLSFSRFLCDADLPQPRRATFSERFRRRKAPVSWVTRNRRAVLFTYPVGGELLPQSCTTESGRREKPIATKDLSRFSPFCRSRCSYSDRSFR